MTPVELRALNPTRRFGTPDEFGALCAFVCSVHAGYLHGQNLLLDGGAFPCPPGDPGVGLDADDVVPVALAVVAAGGFLQLERDRLLAMDRLAQVQHGALAGEAGERTRAHNAPRCAPL